MTTVKLSTDSRIYVAGHRGLVGAAIVRQLGSHGYNNLLTRTREELDLTNQQDVADFFQQERPDYVFNAAAKVGGIHANDRYPAEFLRDNLLIQSNILESAYRSGVQKFLFLGSSCIYPKLAPQPLKEEYLLTGPLEPTNECYAIAKIAGVKACQAYRRQYGFNAISLMPTNLYGPGDNFNLETSHVLPALMRKFSEAKAASQPAVSVWGSGKPMREFLFVDDLADACLFLMAHYDDGQAINVGTGEDISIGQLAEHIRDVVGFAGKIEFDASKPDGTPRKLLDVSRITALGWRSTTSLRDGIEQTYRWYLAQQGDVRD